MWKNLITATRLLWQAAVLLFGRKPKDTRGIYTFWDGKQHRRVDPLVVYRAIMTDEHCRLFDDLKDVQANDWDAHIRIQDLTCRAFGVKRFAEDQTGLTETEIDDLLAEFIIYIQRIKKKRAGSPQSSEHSESKSLNKSDTPTMKRSVVLSGTPTVSTSEKPIRSSQPSQQQPGD